jgi:hypothetical protein
MRFIATWMEKRSGYIDATDAKAAEGVMRHRISLVTNPDSMRLLSIERATPTPPLIVSPLKSGEA